jgi:hypothetical protein
MREDYLSNKLNQFIYDHKVFKEQLYSLLVQRSQTLNKIDLAKLMKDIDDQEISNINDL